MISKFFNITELLQLTTSNYFSVLYYDSEIWHLPSLHVNLKQKLLSSSAKKMCAKYNTNDMPFIKLHELYHRAIPEMFLLYKLALSFFKLFNSNDCTTEWVALNFNQINTSRQLGFITSKTNIKRVGLNVLANRLYVLNGKIPLTLFNKSIDTFKVYCKKEFLSM